MMKSSFERLRKFHLPNVHTIPLELSIGWEPTWGSTPMTYRYISCYRILPEVRMKYLNYPNIFVNLKHEKASFMWNVCILHSILNGFFSPGIMV